MADLKLNLAGNFSDFNFFLGWCIWEGELCVFQEQNLKHFSNKYFDSFLFAHLEHIITTTLCFKTTFTFTVNTYGSKASGMSFFIVTLLFYS